MYKPLTTLAIIALAFSHLYASDIHPIGGRAIALSNAFVSVSDPWSTFHNQAGIAGISTFSAGIFYEKRFMLDELSLAATTLILPLNKGCFGLSFYQFGKGNFKEHKTGLAYSHRLSPKVKAALQLDYISRRFPEHESATGFPTFEMGLIYSTGKYLSLGAHVFNPLKNGYTLRNTKQKVAAIYRMGGHYLFSDLVLLSAEVEKSSGRRALVKTGLEFSPRQNLALRIGVSGTPLRYTAGFGYELGKIRTDIAFSYHETLGLTPSVALQFGLQ